MENETKDSINNLASYYLKTNDDVVFSRLYKSIASEIGLVLQKWEATTYLAERHDITDLYHDALLNSLDKLRTDGSGDFVKIFIRAIHNNYKSLLRKLKTRRKYEALESFIYDEEDERAAPEPDSGIDIVTDIIKKRETKTDEDKRQLIFALTSNTDSLTTAIVNEILNGTDGERPTPTAIGRKLGIHHEKVKRTLRKLSKRYDERQFGSIDTYLAV